MKTPKKEHPEYTALKNALKIPEYYPAASDFDDLVQNYVELKMTVTKLESRIVTLEKLRRMGRPRHG